MVNIWPSLAVLYMRIYMTLYLIWECKGYAIVSEHSKMERYIYEYLEGKYLQCYSTRAYGVCWEVGGERAGDTSTMSNTL